MTKFGVSFVSDIQSFIPLDSLIMKTLFSVGNMLATVGIALLLRHIVRKGTDFIPFLFGFTLASVLGVKADWLYDHCCNVCDDCPGSGK